jgi:hypothetical protein
MPTDPKLISGVHISAYYSLLYIIISSLYLKAGKALLIKTKSNFAI